MWSFVSALILCLIKTIKVFPLWIHSVPEQNFIILQLLLSGNGQPYICELIGAIPYRKKLSLWKSPYARALVSACWRSWGHPRSPGRCKQFSSLQKPLMFVLLWTSLPRTSGYLHLIAIFYMLNSSIISKLIWKGWSLKELSRKAIQPDTSVMSVASGSEFLWRFMFFYCFSPLNGLVSTTKEKNKGTTASFYKGNTFADGNKHRATLFP